MKLNNQKPPIIEDGRHVLVAGRTGSGKSVLAEIYCSGINNVICLDTKGETEWKTIPDVEVFDRLENLVNFKEGKAIYRPRWEELNTEHYDKFFEWIYLRKNTAVWVDEVMSIYENANTILPFHKAIMTRGRTKQISCWNVTQRPRTIPLALISEASHLFIFDLNMEQDRKRINEVVGQPEIMQIPSKLGGEFSFWYYNFKLDKPILSKFNFK